MTLDEQIAQAREELRRLRQRLRQEGGSEQVPQQRLPHDPAFDPWRVRRRRDRYFRMMQGVVVPADSPLVTTVELDDIPPPPPPSGYASWEDARADAEEATRDG